MVCAQGAVVGACDMGQVEVDLAFYIQRMGVEVSEPFVQDGADIGFGLDGVAGIGVAGGAGGAQSAVVRGTVMARRQG